MFKRLFEPIDVGALTLKNRIVMPAVASNLTEFGTVSQRIIDFYTARARGGAGLIITQGLLVIDFNKNINTTALSSDHNVSVDELKKMSAAIKNAGAKAGIQLVHMGNQGITDLVKGELVGPSQIPCLISKDVPRELTAAEIACLVNQFSKAALKAKKAGFDMVELHGAHGYLISNFLSRCFNKRKDNYGTSLADMARFPYEIISTTRKLVGADFTLGIRINGDDYIPGGITIKDAQVIASILEDAGVDYISVSGGVYGSFKATVAPMMEKRGLFASLARDIKKNIKIPVLTTGRINNPYLAEEILQKGWADLIGMGRPLIADPNLPIKSQKNDTKNIRKCIACNQGCIDRINKTILPGKDDGKDASLACLVNPCAGREGELLLKPAAIRKKVLIIGGGPSGMEAARISAKKGHKVILIEQKNKLGGQFNIAAKIPFKKEIQEEINYLSYQMQRLKVEVLTGQKADYNTILDIEPDVVVIATGARPLIPEIKNNSIQTASAWDAIEGKVKLGKNILIIGGGAVGLETAYFLATKGNKITVIEQLNRFAAEMGPISRFYLRYKLSELGVILMKKTRFIDLTAQGVLIKKDGEKEIISDIDTILWAVGSVSNNFLVDKFKNSFFAVHVIGDANTPKDGLAAISQAHTVALKI